MRLKTTLISIILLVIINNAEGGQSMRNINWALHVQRVWNAWKGYYEKTYKDSKEIAFRRMVFTKNYNFIRQHNNRFKMDLETYSTVLNQFADFTQAEFAQFYLNGNRKLSIPRGRANGSKKMEERRSRTLKVLPESVDWREKNMVTSIKNQKSCGSCWAFSTTGSLEGAYAKKTGILASFSEQQLVDCSQKQGNYGCNGGYMSQAFTYLEGVGAESEADYPYTARDGQCRYDPIHVVTNVTGYKNVTSGDEAELMETLATVGPVSVAIDASALGFMFYRHGVYKSHWCSNEYLDHGVLAVGYGSYKGTPYWLVKNSWGTLWGMKGYIMMAKDNKNMCGIATMASYPIIK